MGVVYWVRQVALGLKMLLHAGHTEQEGFGRFRTEAESLARLKHPGIVAIHEVGEMSGLPFSAMEQLQPRRLSGTRTPTRGDVKTDRVRRARRGPLPLDARRPRAGAGPKRAETAGTCSRDTPRRIPCFRPFSA
jgi:hypothetical protein